jgi:hypothetical protein
MKFQKCIVTICSAAFSCLSAAGEIQISVKYGKESITIRSDTPISVFQIHERVKKDHVGIKAFSDIAVTKFVAFPLDSMRFHNKEAVGKNVWLCVGSKDWRDYEIESSCTIQFIKSLKGFSVPKFQIWQFDQEAKDAQHTN